MHAAVIGLRNFQYANMGFEEKIWEKDGDVTLLALYNLPLPGAGNQLKIYLAVSARPFNLSILTDSYVDTEGYSEDRRAFQLCPSCPEDEFIQDLRFAKHWTVLDAYQSYVINELRRIA